MEFQGKRIGHNPAKTLEQAAQPARVTVAVVSFIPFISGYYAESLKVLQVCLESIWENTAGDYDLLVFDNASCAEVRHYLLEAHRQGRIQYLWLSDRNLGKSGAWNILFGGAPGEYLAYADSDIYHYPGWLPALVHVLETFPNAGMVTGIPMWSPEEFSTSTISWAQSTPGVRLERGRYLPWEDYWRHARSLGRSEADARTHYDSSQNLCIVHQGQRYYVGAGHFQFLARRKVLQSILPLPSDRPMGQVRSIDIALNERGFLRLSTPQWWVQHLGNSLEALDRRPANEPPRVAADALQADKRTPSPWKPARKLLLWLHRKTFEMLYRS